ncbi:hypothetical protein L596_008993 [Steinernema carpocapsae]|uniref:Uncharacterized protein n=1 Tax=Steinernema carpocapsae TaxID=34508 RepID=A0A4U5PEW6_STECR|nr:hypothetical protein L596_008993 [Steinernema carpocapsae]
MLTISRSRKEVTATFNFRCQLRIRIVFASPVMRRTLVFALLCGVLLLDFVICAHSSDEDSDEDSGEDDNGSAERAMKRRGLNMLEDVGVTFLDALIKKGQMEMAKGAFKTQMDVLKKVQPDQYKKFKKVPIEQMAADAVFQQAEMAKLQPKTGNKFVDMLHENGIPIGSSLKGIEQAIKTQKEIEDSDPTEQIAKAVFEKFQRQILPGLVANMIAGRNPFQLPQRQDLRKLTDEKNKERVFQVQHADAMKALQAQQLAQTEKEVCEVVIVICSDRSPRSGRVDGGFERWLLHTVHSCSRSNRRLHHGSFFQWSTTAVAAAYPIQKVQGQQYDLNPLVLKKNELRRKPPVEEEPKEDDEDEEEDEEEGSEEEAEDSEEKDDSSEDKKQSNSVRRRHRRDDRAIVSALEARHGRPLKELEDRAKETGEAQVDLQLGSKAALVLGLTDAHGGEQEDSSEEDDEEDSGKRRAPVHLSKDLIEKLRSSPRLRPLLQHEEIKYRASNPEELLAPRRPIEDPRDPQPGYVIPRKIPARPRIMLPLTIGQATDANALDQLLLPKKETFGHDENSKPLEPFRRRPLQSNTIGTGRSRVLENLRNNPTLTALFEDEELVQKLSKPDVLSSDQRGYNVLNKGREIVTYPRLHGAKTHKGKVNPMDAKIKQLVEERPIPPLFYVPTGRHTRLRWTGATEQDIPGLGGRFVVPSLDPTKPALNSVVSTQGKQRDEYDSTFKVPNYWQGGDVFGIKTHTKSEKLIGGNGMVDMPAMGENMYMG